MNIELKNLKHMPALSQETLCFSASLYVDGVKRGTVCDHGTGGSIDIQPMALAREIEQYAATLPPAKTTYGQLTVNADYLLGVMAEDILLSKELKRLLKNRIVFRRGDKILQTKTVSKDDLEAWLRDPDRIADKLQADVILNTLPFDEALTVFKGEVCRTD